MAYSDFYLKKSPQVPLVLAFGVVILIIFLLGQFFFTRSSVPTRAAKNQPLVTFASPSPSSVAFLWQSAEAGRAWILWGETENKLTNIALDARDTSSNKHPYKNHFVKIEKLKSNTTYFYKIVAENRVVEATNGKPFSFTTINSIDKISSVKPAYGKVISPVDNKPVENALVVISIDGAFPLVTLTKLSGEWLIPLNFVVDKKSKNLKVLDEKSEKQKISIQIKDESQESKIISTVASISPLPSTIQLGKNYEFGRNGGSVLAAQDDKTDAQSISITFPKNNSTIPSSNPLIKGTAIAGYNVSLNIESEERTQNTRARADASGLWKSNDVRNLPPGQYLLTISTRNTQNQVVQKTSRFTIPKSGEQVLGVATPEASPTILPPTATPAPTNLVQLSPTPPVTGASPLPFIFASTALVIVGLGLLLAF